MNPGVNPLLLPRQEELLDNEVWQRNWSEFFLWFFTITFTSGGEGEVEVRLEETNYSSRMNIDQEERTNLSGTTDATSNQRAATNIHQRQRSSQSTSNNAVRPPPSAPEYENIISDQAVAESGQAAFQPSSSAATSSRPTANNAPIQNYALSWIPAFKSIPAPCFPPETAPLTILLLNTQ